MKNRLIVTDPDNFQFGIQENETTWEYRQLREGSDLTEKFDNCAMLFANKYNDEMSDTERLAHSSTKDWYIGSVDVQDYTTDEISEFLSSFGYSLTDKGYVKVDSMNEILDRKTSIQIICECIFETDMFTDFN